MKKRPYPLYKIAAICDLWDMISQKIDNIPDHTAFAFWNANKALVTKSYYEFSSDIKALISYLLSREINDTRIGIVGGNSYEWIVAFMAIVCSGNTAVILDKDMGVHDVDDVLSRISVDVIFYADKNYDLVRDSALNETGILKLPLSIVEKINSGEESNNFISPDVKQVNPAELLDPDKCCCIFLTSGTSGIRKGVMLSHKSIATDIIGSSQLFRLDGDTYAVLPFHHAFGLIVGVLMVFHYGHTVYIGSGLKRIRKELLIAKPQTMMLVPLFVENFYKQIWDSARKDGVEARLNKAILLSNRLLKIGIDFRKWIFKDIIFSFGGSLEYIICGGASLDADLVKEFRSIGIEILNGYGTTECSPVVAVNRNKYHKDGTVGLPIPGSEVKISDEGEVLVRGPHVMQGYYGAFSEEDEEVTFPDGWYQTGDLGFIDSDGFITLTGRKKNLIILPNGENVSPEELEMLLSRIENIDEVIVFDCNGHIKAEVFSKCISQASYDEVSRKEIETGIRNAVREMNRGLPTYKRVEEVAFRVSEFEKTSSMKIVRQGV